MDSCIAVITVLFIALGLSWAVTCGFLYLIALCFKVAFSWTIATGIWLVLCLLSAVFKSNNNSKK